MSFELDVMQSREVKNPPEYFKYVRSIRVLSNVERVKVDQYDKDSIFSCIHFIVKHRLFNVPTRCLMLIESSDLDYRCYDTREVMILSTCGMHSMTTENLIQNRSVFHVEPSVVYENKRVYTIESHPIMMQLRRYPDYIMVEILLSACTIYLTYSTEDDMHMTLKLLEDDYEFSTFSYDIVNLF